MAITRQLYQLQDLDSHIEQEEQALASKSGQLGKREALDQAQNQLDAAKQRMKELSHQRHDAEWEVDDILSKIADAEKKLYGGKINNPKELSSLQHEVNTMKSHSDQLETKALEIIDRAENGEREVEGMSGDYQKLEEEWKAQQKQLAEDIEN